ncbi:MAG: hypothetical protein Fur0043_21170 [Anaerolineales bacterium]
MTIRPLDLLDLPALYRYRDEVVGLDLARWLTRGNPLSAGGFMAYFNPARFMYSAVVSEDSLSLLGGITHTHGNPFAKLLYLAPASRLDHPQLPALIEALTTEAGNWGVFHVLAETGETSQAFVALRKAGFAVYAWQRMWDVSNLAIRNTGAHWTRMRSVDLPWVQSLYAQIVPPLLQSIEPALKQPQGMVCTDRTKCYVNVMSGVCGVVLTPFIHPEISDVSSKVAEIVGSISARRNRPVYLCVRSYQAWLEPVLEDLGATASERQAIMVKHLARMVKGEQAVPTMPIGVSVQPSQVSKMEEQK